MEALQLQDVPVDERKAFFDEKAQSASEAKEEELLADFDAAYQEYKSNEVPLVVKFMGEKFEVPRERPVGVTVWTAREQQNGALTDDKFFVMIEKIFGEQFIEKLEECDAPESFVTENILQPLFEKWGVKGTAYKKK